MRYDGMNFRRSKKVVMLPREFCDEENYVMFGRTCSKDEKGAVKTAYKWCVFNPYIEDFVESKKDLEVWAKPIPKDFHSLTNMMYSTDGNVYLAYDGQCFVHSWRNRINKQINHYLDSVGLTREDYNAYCKRKKLPKISMNTFRGFKNRT